MRASTAGLDVVIDGRDQPVFYRFSMPLPGGVYPDLSLTVDAIHIEGDTVTDQVGGTRLEDGYTAFEGTVTLSGRVDPKDETKNAAWLFARYPFPAADGTLSPLAYTDMHDREISIEFGSSATDKVEVLWGFVDGYQQTPEGQVVFTIIDGRTLLRGSGDLAPVVTAPPYNAGLTSEFAIDYLLRAATKGAISSWPAQRSNALLSAGLRSSLWPEVGTLIGSPVTPSFVPCVNGSGYTDSALGAVTWRLATPVSAASGTVFFEAFIRRSTINSGISITIAGTDLTSRLQVSFTATQVRLNGAASGIAIGPGTSYIAAALTLPAAGSTAFTGTLWINNSANSISGNMTAAPSGAYDTVQVSVSNDPSIRVPTASIEALQVTGEDTTAVRNHAFQPRAVLDPSLNPLQIIPAITGDPWQTIQQIAGAELGMAGFFGGRIFRFYNRRSITARPISKTVHSDGALETVGVSSERASIVNHAKVGYTTWTFATARTAVYSTAAPINIPRRGTKTFTVTLDTYATDLDTSVVTLPDGTNDPTQSWVRYATNAAGTARHPGGVLTTVRQIAANQITVTIVNNSDTDAWTVTSAEYTDTAVGTPLFRIAGRAVTPNEEVQADYQWPTPELGGASSSRFGEVLAEINGNPWIQDDGAALDLCKTIVLDNYEPRCDFGQVAILPDPRIEPGDALHLIDSDRTGVDEYVRVYGFNLDYEAENEDGGMTYEMTLQARAFGPPGAWLLGIPGRSELGVTTYLR